MNAKIFIGALALASAANAWALAPTVTPDIQIFMAGATAQKNTLPNLLGGYAGGVPTTWTSTFSFPAVQPLCIAGTLDIFYDPAQTAPVVLKAGSNYRAYSCTLASTANVPTPLQGKKILIHYRLLGGSWIGVGPLSRGQSVARMAIDSTCTAVANTTIGTFPLPAIYNSQSYTCPNTTVGVPDIGVSDQEPSIFFANNAPNDGNPGADATARAITAGDLANITYAPLQGVVMGVIASKALVNAMQTAQGFTPTATTAAVTDAVRPSIQSTTLTSTLVGVSPVYTTDWSGVLGAAGTGYNVHICRRISAVGTQIAANAFWLNYPCAATAQPPSTGSVYPNTITTVPTGPYTVVEANLIADLRVCVQNYNNQATATERYAIGLLFGDNSPSTEAFSWDFLSIDGIAPSIPNAASGKYRYVTTETWQYRQAAVNGVAALTDPANSLQLQLAQLLFSPTALGLPKGGLGAPNLLSMQVGFLAIPDAPNAFIPGTLAGDDGDNVWKGSTQGPQTCNPPNFFY